MPSGYTYILKCANGQYYTGSTIDLDKRIQQHKSGLGANFTKKNAPVELVYYENFQRIDWVFYREHQIKRWSQQKKQALIDGRIKDLKEFAKCMNETNALKVFLAQNPLPSRLSLPVRLRRQAGKSVSSVLNISPEFER